MTKKPELYRIEKGPDGQRIETNYKKIAIWSNLYYRRNGKRIKYKVVETGAKRPKSDKYTRWQLHYDLKKPWHVTGRYPKDFATFEEAIKYATTEAISIYGPAVPKGTYQDGMF